MHGASEIFLSSVSEIFMESVSDIFLKRRGGAEIISGLMAKPSWSVKPKKSRPLFWVIFEAGDKFFGPAHADFGSLGSISTNSSVGLSMNRFRFPVRG